MSASGAGPGATTGVVCSLVATSAWWLPGPPLPAGTALLVVLAAIGAEANAQSGETAALLLRFLPVQTTALQIGVTAAGMPELFPGWITTGPWLPASQCCSTAPGSGTPRGAGDRQSDATPPQVGESTLSGGQR